jgi:hypothetical protein
MVELTEIVIFKLVDIYERLAVLDIADSSVEAGSNENINDWNSNPSMIDSPFLQNTNKLISVCYAKCIEFTNNPEDMLSCSGSFVESENGKSGSHSKERILNHILLKYIEE